MRFLILSIDYSGFLNWLYTKNKGLASQSYSQQMLVRNESLFGITSFYSNNLRRLGHEAWDVHTNNEYLQAAWAREHGLSSSLYWSLNFRFRKQIIPWVSIVRNKKWLINVLEDQIHHYQPDVIIDFNVGLDKRFIQRIRP